MGETNETKPAEGEKDFGITSRDEAFLNSIEDQRERMVSEVSMRAKVITMILETVNHQLVNNKFEGVDLEELKNFVANLKTAEEAVKKVGEHFIDKDAK